MNTLPLAGIGRAFVAIALLGIGTEHIIFQEFVLGRAPPWPVGLPGKSVWAIGSGAFVVAAAIMLVMRRWARQAMLGLAFMVSVWALLRHLPIVLTDQLLAGSWTRAGKALTFVGGLAAVAGTLPLVDSGIGRRYANATGSLVRLGAICLGCFLIIGGLQHFKFTAFVMTLFPAWFPGNLTYWTRFAGIALMAGGAGLLIPRTTRLAGMLVGLMLFSWVWIVHLPRMFVSVSDGIAVFEALAFAGIALVVSSATDTRHRHSR